MPVESTEKNDLCICNPVNEGHPVKEGRFVSENAEKNSFKKIWWPRLPFAALLIIFTVSAYLPSLDKVFIKDQLSYFLELDGDTSLASGLRLLDYGVERQYRKGDEVLYRPLLFSVLAFENTLFYRDFRLWNVANLVFHLLVVYLLFEVLWHIQRTLLACGFALLFSLLTSNFGLVTWNHLGGYILGYGLLLVALWSAREMRRDKGDAGTKLFWIYGVAMTGAMLFHEIAVIVSFVLLAYAGWSKGEKADYQFGKRIAALSTPIFLYAVLYTFHVLRCKRFFWLTYPIDTDSSLIGYLTAIPLLVLQWLQYIFLPIPGQHIISAMNLTSMWIPSSISALMPEILVPGAIWMGTLVCLRRGFERNHLKKSLPFGALILFLIVAYAGLNTVGRFPYAMRVSHYVYFPALFGFVLLYYLIDFSRVKRTGKAGALTLLLLLSVYNGWQVRNMSCQTQDIYNPVARYLKWVEKNVRPKLSKPEYSFYIKGVPQKLDIKMLMLFGYDGEGYYVEKNLLYILYGKYYNLKSPSEIFVVRDYLYR